MKIARTFNVICTSGATTHKVLEGVSYNEALAFCEEHGWIYDYNGGLWWDLQIEAA